MRGEQFDGGAIDEVGEDDMVARERRWLYVDEPDPGCPHFARLVPPKRALGEHEYVLCSVVVQAVASRGGQHRRDGHDLEYGQQTQ